MFLTHQTRRCLRCGHNFTYIQGDLIFDLLPKCPKCGSHLTFKKHFI